MKIDIGHSMSHMSVSLTLLIKCLSVTDTCSNDIVRERSHKIPCCTMPKAPRRYFGHGTASALLLFFFSTLFQTRFNSSFNSYTQYRVLNAQVDAVSHLRFVAFGTSRTWGSGLKDRYDAYPFLLSPNVTNLAIRAADCEYPSLCTMSMVQDGIFDVILIEYNHVSQDKPRKHFQRLAMRLRHRFPNAIIIFIYAWSPFQYINSKNGKTPFDTRIELFPSIKGLREAKLGDMWQTIATTSAISPTSISGTATTDTTPGTTPAENTSEDKGNSTTATVASTLPDSTLWRLEGDDTKNREIVHQTALSVGGLVWELPRLDDATANLAINGRWFLPDCTHYSKEGHRVIQQGILELLVQQQREMPTTTRNDTVRQWESWDQCDSWYTTGQTRINTTTNMAMVEFSKHKFALEGPGFMDLLVDRPSMLYINYMAGGPEQIYPNTAVRVEEQSNSRFKMNVIVVPIVDTNVQGKSAVHVVQTATIGRVEAGAIRIELLPLEEQQNPFRMVGVVLIKDEEVETLLVPKAEVIEM
jgi:hypothetical protein